MLVQGSNLKEVLAALAKQPALALDTETTGLRWWQDDELFSIIFATAKREYYFNFGRYPGLAEDWILPRSAIASFQAVLDQVPLIFAHNAKFDMGMLSRENLTIKNTVHCTQAIHRLVRNDLLKYSLDALTGQKDDSVKKYIKEHGLYKKERHTFGNVVIDEKHPCYDKVPLEVMVPYAKKDARLCFDLGMKQIAELGAMQAKLPPGIRGPLNVMATERKITKVFFAMEKFGVAVDQPFSQKGLDYELGRAAASVEEFERIACMPFNDHHSTLAKAFDAAGERYPLTDKGNPSFAAEVLEDYTSPLAKLVLSYRSSTKRGNTYFKNFLYYSDRTGRIHPNMLQGGTATGRISYSDPNFQNLPKRKEAKDSKFNIRRAIKPRPGHCLVMLDYDQMEYRLMLEYAQEMELIRQVIGGLDVHSATANLASIGREYAKTLNFLLLYGGGPAKACVSLFNPTLPLPILQELVRKHFYKSRVHNPHLIENLPADALSHNLAKLKKAVDLVNGYFESLPNVQKFTRGVMKRAKERGWIKTWSGRFLYCSRGDFAYKLPNHTIQGGCADVMKEAMVEIAALLEGTKSMLMVQVHDEVLLDMHPDDFHLVPRIQEIMENAYPHRFLKLTAGVDHSWVSWADKVEGFPIAQAA